MFIWPWQLNKLGILGMNRRNHDYISRYNPRHLYPLVDNKLKTKEIMTRSGITTPRLVGVVSNQYEVSQLGSILANAGATGFAIKPAKGSGGKGIVVLRRTPEGVLIKTSGAVISLDELQRHVSNTLSGLHSLGGSPDIALIEEIIEFDQSLNEFSYEGVPDIRIIVCRGYPVMAMTRLATKASDGKANLHQGAVGVGLDIATGKPLNAVQFGEQVTKHPDTGVELSKLTIPHWDKLLELAARCYEVSGLGYLGTDMVLDKNHGPMLLELNARPGLAIQVANGTGLLTRLKVIDKLSAQDLMRSAAERVALSQQWFAAKQSDLFR
ncbi:MAG: alpha-L-glutamate ligase-like protein [Venatoribacter sp.]